MVIREGRSEDIMFAISFNEIKIARGERKKSEIICEINLDNVDETLRREIIDAAKGFKKHLKEIALKGDSDSELNHYHSPDRDI